ncbi:signal peptidase I [Ligaoa zhengdingensis]|uniref:signal peptidase I n=1 Tax=Ligaoa zhengdingensis TaxID=2763658 RepID=UPI0031BAC34F
MSRTKRFLHVLNRCISVVLTVLLVGLFLVMVYLIIASNTQSMPFFNQYSIYTVTTGSMTGTLDVGSVIVVKKVDPQTLEEGDIITFLSNDPMFNGKVVTHRIVEVTEGTGGKMFITKGDANEDRDGAAALPSNVLGKVVLHIPWLGYLLAFLKTKQGYFLILILPCFALLVVEVIQLIKNICRYVDEKDQKKLDSESQTGEISDEKNSQDDQTREKSPVREEAEGDSTKEAAGQDNTDEENA